MTDTQREFETKFKHLDLTKYKDAWGRPKYKHSHVDALHDGFEAGYQAALAHSQWQQIETAPKDGTVIILGHAEHKAITGWYENSQWLKRAGSYTRHTPTHWMPLPQPPITNRKDE